MRILVCGGRDFDDWNWLSFELEKVIIDSYRSFVYAREYVTIISGDAIGADWLTRAWAKYYCFGYEGYPADWKKYKRAAGAIRNQQMLDEGKPDLVIAFPGGSGTADMVRRAKKAGIKVIEV